MWPSLSTSWTTLSSAITSPMVVVCDYGGVQLDDRIVSGVSMSMDECRMRGLESVYATYEDALVVNAGKVLVQQE